MTYQDQIAKVTEHLQRHPSDYQSVISLYKIRSNAIEHEIAQKRIEKQKMVAKCREILKERQNEESAFE